MREKCFLTYYGVDQKKQKKNEVGQSSRRSEAGGDEEARGTGVGA